MGPAVKQWLLLEAVGDIQSALPNVVLCIIADSIGPQDHSEKGVSQLGALACPQGHHPLVFQLLGRGDCCTTTYRCSG